MNAYLSSFKRLRARGFWLGAVVVAWLSVPGLAGAQVPARYVNALQRASYTIFSGDQNGDGYVDILARPKPNVVPIDLGDLIVPIVFYVSPVFALLSDGGGGYTIVVNPSASIRNSAVWQANTYDAVFGDISGGGAGGMFLRGKASGTPSFTVATSSANGAPLLLQKIGSSELGIDLTATGTTVQLKDSNRDTRADLIVRVNGVISTVLTADAQGHFQAPIGDAGGVIAAWRAFCAALDAGDVVSAMRFVSTYSSAKYSGVLGDLGPDISTVTQYWSDIAAIRVQPRFANYLLTQTIAGVERGFELTFVKEDGRWVIEEM